MKGHRQTDLCGRVPALPEERLLLNRIHKRARGLFTAAALSLLLCTTGCTSLKVLSYEGPGRDRWQQPEEVIRVLDIQPGDVVADIGSGGGYFSLHLAEAVGPEGTVYAADIDPAMNRYLERRARRAGHDNIKTILADPDDPNLPETGVDLIFMSNTYHYLDDPTAYFSDLQRTLGPSGRLAIIDFDGTKWRHRVTGHFSRRDEVLKELQTAGYELVEEFHFTDRQYFLVFSQSGS